MRDALARLNALSDGEARQAFLDCCGAHAWAAQMATRRPFTSSEELLEAAERLWDELSDADWLEAFCRHPRIGQKKAPAPPSAQAGRWSEQEQAGTRLASEEGLVELQRANEAYEERFGYLFIVCATGKSAEEMLALLRQRLQNEPADELRIAAEEQRRITRLRLLKLLET